MSLHPTVVIGMHRSGTSAVTACLSALGLAVPHLHEQIIAPDNPAHLEPRRIALHNDELLASAGAKWDYPSETRPAASNKWKDQAIQLMSEAFPDSPWVLKDPRMCLLLESWDMLPESTRYVFVSRSPVDVAASLARRDHMTAAHGEALWEIYNATAEASLQGKPVYALTFEQLRGDPEVHLRGLAEFIGSREDPRLDAQISTATNLLDPKLGNAADVAPTSIGSARWRHLESLAGAHSVFESGPQPQLDSATQTIALHRQDRARRSIKRVIHQGPVKIASARLTRLGQKAHAVAWRKT